MANPPNTLGAGFSDGLVTAPVLTFQNETGTGRYRAGAGQIGEAVGGVQVAQIDANGLASAAGLRLNGVTAGGAGSLVYLFKAVSAIADNAATDTFTVTIPNATHAALIKARVVAALGAGGAVGAGESTVIGSRDFSVNRFAGASTVVAAATAGGVANATSSGGSTATLTIAASSVTGGSTATQTFTVQVTVGHGSGSSTNHSALVEIEVLNQNANGITAA
jgi:hypothetical protein